MFPAAVSRTRRPQPFEQCLAEFFLELSNLLAQGRLRHLTGLRSARKTSHLGDSHEIPQLVDLHRISSLQQSSNPKLS